MGGGGWGVDPRSTALGLKRYHEAAAAEIVREDKCQTLKLDVGEWSGSTEKGREARKWYFVRGSGCFPLFHDAGYEAVITSNGLIRARGHTY